MEQQTQDISVTERAIQAMDAAVEGIQEPVEATEQVEEAVEQVEAQAEQPVEQPPVETEKQKLVSQQYQAMIRLERQNRELMQELKSLKESKAPQIDPEIQKLIELKEEAKFDPIAWLEAAGLTYDEITEYQLNGGRPRESKDVVNLKKTIEEMKKEMEQEREAKEAQAKEHARNAKVSEIKAEILERKEEYPLISIMNTYVDPNSGQVINLYETIDDVVEEAAKEGLQLSRFDAAKKVESFVTKNIEQEFTHLAAVPAVRKMAEAILAKYKSPVNNVVKDEPRLQDAPQYSNAEETSTLSNTLNQAAGKTTSRELTDEERRQRAIQALGNF